MKKRITIARLIAIATPDATVFMFPRAQALIEKDKRKASFLKLRK